MAGESIQDQRKAVALRRAAALMSEALDLLDAHGGPAEAAAHLDVALQRVREASETR